MKVSIVLGLLCVALLCVSTSGKPSCHGKCKNLKVCKQCVQEEFVLHSPLFKSKCHDCSCECDKHKVKSCGCKKSCDCHHKKSCGCDSCNKCKTKEPLKLHIDLTGPKKHSNCECNHRPVVHYSVPEPAYHAPQPVYHAPQPAYEAPKPAYHVPQPTYEAPKPVYHAPQPAYEAPKPAYHAPQPTYEAPKPAYEAPKPAYQAPQPTYHAPPQKYTSVQPSYQAPKPKYESRPKPYQPSERPCQKTHYETYKPVQPEPYHEEKYEKVVYLEEHKKGYNHDDDEGYEIFS